jgi:hypothetical protein
MPKIKAKGVKMPRTKGAKNKPLSDSKLRQIYLERFGALSEGKKAEPKENEPKTEPIKKMAKTSFSIAKPKAEKQENDQSAEHKNSSDIVIRCGNPACKKILQNEVDVCPFCGCKLSWQ